MTGRGLHGRGVQGAAGAGVEAEDERAREREERQLLVLASGGDWGWVAKHLWVAGRWRGTGFQPLVPGSLCELSCEGVRVTF